MMNKERREFRKAARTALRQAVRKDTIGRLQRGIILLKMRDDDVVDEMADMCLAQAVECGLVSESQVGGNIDWVGLGENIDWEKLVEFILMIIPMFL